MTDLRDRPTGDTTYIPRVDRYEYIVRRRSETPKPTLKQIGEELGISKQNVSRTLARGTVRPSGRQRNNDGRKRRLITRLSMWASRRAAKIADRLDTTFEDKWIADLEGRLRELE